ncbi:MAG TPA: chitobiase/beta-hexosaminidase C-terminal domain-containing protein [Silvibacterium sp.]|nr:chitobiase/beta-hexosaminidase C-terminal domain-containing protein [Silvibacterium sp.]
MGAFHPYLAKPTFSPPAGSNTTPQSVTISDISTKTIYYTTDGSVPTT